MRFLLPLCVSVCLTLWGMGHGSTPAPLERGDLRVLPAPEPVPEFRPIAKRVVAIGRQWDIPALISLKLVRVESNYDPDAVSRVGAIGYTQVMPATGLWFCGLRRQDLFAPDANLACGFAYLNYLHQRFGTWSRALMAYHRGPGRLAREARLGLGHGTSVRYARLVLD